MFSGICVFEKLWIKNPCAMLLEINNLAKKNKYILATTLNSKVGVLKYYSTQGSGKQKHAGLDHPWCFSKDVFQYTCQMEDMHTERCRLQSRTQLRQQ